VPQGRRVRRVVRKIDTWSVLKVSALFYLSLVLVLLIAGVILWAAGSSVGAIDSVEKFMRAIGFDDFRFVGSQLFRGFTAAGLVLVILGTGLSVLIAVIYNLISDVVGGIQLTVLEEDVRPEAAPAAAPRRVAGTNGATGHRAAHGDGTQPVERPEEQPVAPGYSA
jgi:hypothetical protein